MTLLSSFALLFLLMHQPSLWQWQARALGGGIVLLLLVSAILLPRGATAAGMTAVILAGIGLYAIPAVAGEWTPPMYFGYPRAWEGFRHMITRGQYERVVLSPVFQHPMYFREQLYWLLKLALEQFGALLGIAALFPIVRVTAFRGPWLRVWVLLLLGAAMFGLLLLIGANPKMDVQDRLIQRTKFMPLFAILAIWIGAGLTMLLHGLDQRRAPTDNAGKGI